MMYKKNLLLLFFILSQLNILAQDECGEIDLLTDNTASICDGASVLISAIPGHDNYNWSNGSNNQYTSISIPGTYSVSTSFTTNNLVINGDFNNGNSDFSSSYTYSNDLWPDGNYSITTNANLVHSNFTGTGDGNFMVVNGSTIAGTEVWCQNVVVDTETTYNFSSLVSTVANGNPSILQFSINGNEIGTAFTAPDFTQVWDEFNAIWNSNTSTNAEICIVNQNTSGGGNDFGLDDITFTTICSFSESITVIEEEEANTTIFSVDELCEFGNDINLESYDAGGIWSGNGIINSTTGTFSPSTAGSGTHLITYTIEGDCGNQSETEIDVIQAIESSITGPSSICQNEDPVNLQGIPGIGSWSGSGVHSEDGLFTPSEAEIGINTISFQPFGFCISESTKLIQVHEVSLPETDLFHEICFGDVINLNTGLYLFSNYNWSNGETTSSINISNSGIFSLEITDFNECIQNIDFTVNDQDNCEFIVMPNIFSPNNDYDNDLFVPVIYKHVPTSTIKIYNRWGKEVFFSNYVEEGWDGKHFSKECSEGVYYWVIEYFTNQGASKSMDGYVTLLR